jgi:carboxylesterase type B
MFRSLAVIIFASLFLQPTSCDSVNPGAPSATVANGTYVGKYVAEWQQDQFLGIPFAIPPLGPLRFARPQSLNTTFSGTRNATEYGFSCYQYGTNFTLSEDCLTLNGMCHLRDRGALLTQEVLRPAGTSPNERLPVLVWIYGGGLYTGSTADPQYNLSGITHVGQQIGRPVITGIFSSTFHII